MNNYCPGCKWWHPTNQLAELLQDVDNGWIDVTTLPDLVLVVANRWSSGTSAILSGEVKRRLEHYSERARFFETGRPG